MSSEVIDRYPAKDLIAGLREAGFEVDHSPSNPLDRDDPRWANWYAEGLPKAMDQCDAFVVALERHWDSATWMGIEGEEALKAGRRTAEQMFVWNPEGITVHAAGMIRYLQAELPRDLSGAITHLCKVFNS